MNGVYNGIMGLVVGDALGVPVEFRPRDSFRIDRMTGYGTYNQPIGTWSDDSSMVLATMESLVQCNGIDPEHIMCNFVSWYKYGLFTPYGYAFDIGNTTKAAIQRSICGFSPMKCGGKSEMDNGNGSLMRILPLAFVPHSINDIRNVSALTHAHEISMTACEIYIDIATALLNGSEKSKAVEDAFFGGIPTEFERAAALVTTPISRDDIQSTGYVVSTLEAALWCFLTTYSYRDCVLEAVNLGGDTDTIAAIAGGLAGIYYGTGGENGIPEEWIAQIARKDYIAALCKDVANICG